MTDTSSGLETSPALADAQVASAELTGIERLYERAVDTDFERVVGVVVQTALTDTSDPLQAMRAVVDSLGRYFNDPDMATLLVSLLAYWDDKDYVASALEPIHDQSRHQHITSILSRLSGQYGRQIRVKYDQTTRDPKDWQWVEVRPSYDLEQAQWIIELRVQNFAQEEMRVVGPPLSFLRLVNRLLEPLLDPQRVGGGDPKAEYDDEAVSTFLELAGRMTAAFQAPSTDGEGPEEQVPASIELKHAT